MKIMSWNVNGIRACYKKNMVGLLKEHRPDILCLQETKAHMDQVEEGARLLGYQHSYWSSAHRKGYSGVATFLNIEPQKIEKGIGIEKYDSEGRFVITEHEKFDLYNIYFPNGGSGEERHNFKQEFLKDLASHLKQKIKKGRSLIVVGDYNIAHTEIDIYDPVKLANESGFLPEERKWMDEFLEMGFVDTFRFLHPDDIERYTWWAYRTFARVRNDGWRIDYICVTKDLQKKIKKAEILDAIEGSDHCPITLELD